MQGWKSDGPSKTLSDLVNQNRYENSLQVSWSSTSNRGVRRCSHACCRREAEASLHRRAISHTFFRTCLRSTDRLHDEELGAFTGHRALAVRSGKGLGCGEGSPQSHTGKINRTRSGRHRFACAAFNSAGRRLPVDGAIGRESFLLVFRHGRGRSAKRSYLGARTDSFGV